ncbi:uncharacterized protein LOC112564777 [Pomacea canaliculata]|uniref:uncharacterized protein LOC112564777 n=1 Tax=Pomacea canaliculata TaxID=400727 RepID=UPI000D73350F|nr:uncharacterized protein LOC112564777 [Pomacea canaliculata]
MCCSFSRLRKLSESEDVLASYDAVRRASATVRHISHANNTPLLSSRSGSMTLVRDQRLRRGFRPRDSCHSAPGTLQRHHRNRDSTGWQNSLPTPPPPPAYGGPPAYPLDDDDAFLGPDIPLQDFHEADVRHAEGHRRQRPYSTSDGYMTG